VIPRQHQLGREWNAIGPAAIRTCGGILLAADPGHHLIVKHAHTFQNGSGISMDFPARFHRRGRICAD
jgi:hypothetical protein